MAGMIPPSVAADGTTLTVLLATVPTVTETGGKKTVTLADAAAATAAAISCYLSAGGFDLKLSQATITDQRECSTTDSTDPGRKSYTLTITGIDNTNSEYEEDYNLLVDSLPEGQRMAALRRRGKAYDTDLAAGDKCQLVIFRPGAKAEVTPEANSTQRATWTCFVQDVIDVEIAA